MAQAHPFNAAFTSAFSKQISVPVDTFKLQLHTSAYTPNKGTHRFQSDLTNELPAGNGYTVGGNVISGMAVNMINTNAVQTIPAQAAPFSITVSIGGVALTTASIAAGASNTTVQNAIAALGHVGVGNVTVTGAGPYTVTFGGTLGAQAITLMVMATGTGPVANTTPGVGTFYITGGNVSWPNSTFIAPNAARYGVIVDTTPGSAATNPILGIVDFVTDQSPTNGTLSVTWDPTGIVVVTVA
ncbi:MAG: hypothetical protein JO214_00690 [Frankiaceae bacterium]|nr:hypothetical protein [Frankiaceae bacterium]